MGAPTLALVGCLVLLAPSAWGAADNMDTAAVMTEPPPAVADRAATPASRAPEPVPQIDSYRIATIAAGVVAGVVVVNAAAGIAAAVGIATAAGAANAWIGGPVLATVARDAAIAVGATVGGVLGNWAYLNRQ